MASVTFKRGTKAEIEATAKQDGQILMETDQTNNKMYVDLQNNNRVRIGNSNVDDISGITDSLTATSSNIALSAAGGNNLQGQIDTLNRDLKHYESTICNIGNVKITRFNIEGGRMCIEFYDKDGNSYTFRAGISSKEVIVDSVINGAFSRNQII